jgi:hypothetical protein
MIKTEVLARRTAEGQYESVALSVDHKPDIFEGMGGI